MYDGWLVILLSIFIICLRSEGRNVKTEGHLVQSRKEKKKKKERSMTDGYGKPENLTPVLLWSSTANRFQTRDKRKNRAPTTLPSK